MNYLATDYTYKLYLSFKFYIDMSYNFSNVSQEIIKLSLSTSSRKDGEISKSRQLTESEAIWGKSRAISLPERGASTFKRGYRLVPVTMSRSNWTKTFNTVTMLIISLSGATSTGHASSVRSRSAVYRSIN